MSKREKPALVWNVVGEFTDQSGYKYLIHEAQNGKANQYRIENDKRTILGYAGTLGKAWSSVMYMARVNPKTHRTPNLDWFEVERTDLVGVPY